MLAFFHQLFENLKTSPARKNKLILISLFLALGLNIGIWLLLIIKFRAIALSNPEKLTLPLHYNIYWGIDLFGQWYQGFIMPALGMAILIFNFILAIYFYSLKILASYFLIVSAAMVQIFLLISVILMILINI
ncbi:MAG: hypothetical protein ACOZBH_01660 [Patescibacteria group bacterium]